MEEIEGKEPLNIGPFDHFSIKLSRLSIKLSYLVSIKLIYLKMLGIIFYFISIFLLFRYCCRIFLLNFHNIFKQGRFNKVTLHGLLMDVECKVLKGKPPSRRIKLGKGWKHLCSLHSFREGDKIIFECDTRNPSSHIRVLLLTSIHSLSYPT